jgi:molybdopterin/thiamine biosynthesis adenylyltransferase
LYNFLLCLKFPGAETTAKLTKMKVLIFGLRGVGVETAKNLALQGVGGMTVSYLVVSHFSGFLSLVACS